MEYRALGELCTITSSKRIFADQYVESGIPFYRSKEIIEKYNNSEISEPLYISPMLYASIKTRFGVPKKGEMLLTSVGTIGIPYIVKDEEFYFKDGNLTWMKNFSEDLSSSYLYYWITSKFGKESLTSRCIGSSQSALTIDILKKYKLLVPTRKTQDNIVSILANYDNLIEVNNKRIKVLEQMAENLYKEWFVRFRFPGHETAEFENGIPKGWEEKRLEQFGISLDSGSRPSGGVNDSLEDGMPSLGAEAVNGLGEFDYSNVKLIPFLYYDQMKRGKNTGRDILVYKDGAYIGKTTIFMNGFPYAEFAVNEHVFLLNALKKEYQFYLYFTLHLPEYFALMQNLNRNAAQPGLSKLDMNRIKMVVPNIETVRLFNETIEPILAHVFGLALQTRNLTKQRDLLLPRLMSGKLEV